jgi:NAD(P)-dependent dehydrogenase (short-subunit alcohol dehydrogenase family)
MKRMDPVADCNLEPADLHIGFRRDADSHAAEPILSNPAPDEQIAAYTMIGVEQKGRRPVMFDLKGKVAIVTGASSGIGRTTAKLFARAGAKVVIGARRKAELESLVREIADQGHSALALAGDVSDEAFAKELVERAEQNYGRLDVAFNNAGILGERGPTTDISLDGWNEALRVNLTGAFLAAKHQIPAMLKQGKGSIIFTGTFVGYTVGFPGIAVYAASKSGLIGLTQTLAAEYGPQNIRVNAILPGSVDTPMYKVASGTAEQQAYITNMHALKRIASPDELAQAVLYLASDASSFQSGTAMLVDGGLSITRT